MALRAARALLLVLALLPLYAGAADYTVSSAGTVDGDTFCSGTCQPGDRLVLSGTISGKLTFSDLQGTSGDPILIVNDTSDTSRAVVQRTDAHSGDFVMVLRDSRYVTVDGTGGWSGMPAGAVCPPLNGAANGCGIYVTNTNDAANPSVFFSIRGISRDITVKGMEINGRWPTIDEGICIQAADTNVSEAANPGVRLSDITIDGNYFRNCEGEGIYIGHTYGDGDRLKVEDATVRNNWVYNTGWDCSDIKQAIYGTNLVHDNRFENCGAKTDAAAGQHDGAACLDGACTFYNNIVIRAGEYGLKCRSQNMPSSAGPLTCDFYNNLVVEPGITGPVNGIGIQIGRESSAYLDYNGTIYNNTVTDTEAAGIAVGSAVSGTVNIRNNIVCNPGGSAISGGTQSNNLTGTACASVGFTNYAGEDFSLTAGSSAVDTLTTGFPATDIVGTSRPVNTNADQGAYEYEAPPDPDPPVIRDDIPHATVTR